jgi:hypothetical protein
MLIFLASSEAVWEFKMIDFKRVSTDLTPA